MPKHVNGVPKLAAKSNGRKKLAGVWIGGKFFALGAYWGTAEARQLYDSWVVQWLAAGRPAQWPPPRDDSGDEALDVTVAELVRDYYRHLKKTAPSYFNYRPSLKRFRKMFGKKLAVDIRVKQLERFRNHCIQSMTTPDKKPTREYVNKMVHMVKQMFEWAAGEELIHEQCYQHLMKLKPLKPNDPRVRDPERVQHVPDEVVDATLPFCPPVIRDMVNFQRLTGARPGEIFALTPEQVDRETEDGLWWYRPVQHKTRHRQKQRHIAIGPQAQALLAPYLLRPGDAHCFSPIESEKRRRQEQKEAKATGVVALSSRVRQENIAAIAEDALMKYRARGKHGFKSQRPYYDKNSYRRAIQRAAKAAGQPHWHPHQLRHLAATNWASATGDLRMVQHGLGHSTMRMAEHYTHDQQMNAGEIARQFG